MSGNKPWVSRKLVSQVVGRGALLALAALLATHGLLMAEASDVDSRSSKLEDDEESDNAPFAVAVQHDKGTGSNDAWYCGGSLVSLRTALTSRWCARGRELWVLAAALLPARAPGRMEGVRRIARVAFANELGGLLPGDMEESSEAVVDDAWSGASLDIALLELESPFGARAGVRPILMATATADCGFPNACHAVGVHTRGSKPLLRIFDLDMARGDVCADIARHWAAVRDHVLCLSGTELCPSDRGAGVVCGGKLCGVVSRSARAGRDAGAGCGEVHAAQSVWRWRRFLQCAQSSGACGREGECTDLCTERVLLPEAVSPSTAQATSRRAPPTPTTTPQPPAESSASSSELRERTITTTSLYTESTETTYETRRKEKARERGHKLDNALMPTRSPPPRSPARALPARPPPASARHTPAPPPTPVGAPPLVHPPRMEFDPSRADFKAGEYGDNAADYAGLVEEAAGSSKPSGRGAPSSRRTPAPPPTRTPPSPSTRLVLPSAEPRAAAEFFPASPAAGSFARVAKVDEQTPKILPVELAATDTSASAKRPNILYSTCFIPLFISINIIY